MGKTVELKYKVDLNRRFTLSEIRLTGTNELTVDDIKSVLGTQTPNILGWIPYLGYGRGYTSETILEQDVATVKSLMRELGYRDAQVRVNRGVSPTADNLIITFVVEEGPPTVVNNVDVTGNVEVAKDALIDQLPPIVGKTIRAKVRNAAHVAEYYANAGYFDAKVTPSLIEEPDDPATGQNSQR